MKTDSDTADLKMATLLGGVTIFVENHQGEKLEVFVRQLPLRLLHPYLKLQIQGDEQGLVELLCHRRTHWSDCLSDASILAILEKGKDINFTRAVAWMQRKEERVKLLSPIAHATARALVKETQKSLEKTLSPLSATSPSKLPPSSA